MSIFGAMSTAVLGLSAQSKALGHISDNIANAQTVAYKGVNTAFNTLVMQSSYTNHSPGGVVAKPVYANTQQGGLTQSETKTNIAVQGDGFFTVTRPVGGVMSEEAELDTFYTRLGDFELDLNRYLSNTAGFQLNGWVADEVSGEINTFGPIGPIRVLNTLDKPVPTSKIDLYATLPATPKAGESAPTTPITIYDGLGQRQDLTLKWRQTAENDWRLILEAPSSLATARPMGTGFAGETPVITKSSVIEGREPRKQVDTVTFSASNESVQVGESYTVTVNGVVFTQSITLDRAAELSTFNAVANALAAKINSATPPVGVNATTDTGGRLVLTSSSAGTPFSSSVLVSQATVTDNAAPVVVTSTAASADVAQVSKLTFSGPGIDIGDSFAVTVGTETYTISATAGRIGDLRNITGVVQYLSDRINSDPDAEVIASASGGVLTLRARSDNVPFTVTGTVAGNGTSEAIGTTLKQPTNITGLKQSQTVSLSGGVGDIGANYMITVKSPTQAAFTSAVTTSATATAAQVATATFQSTVTPAVGMEYNINIAGTRYSVLLTEENISDYPDVDSIIDSLSERVNSDYGAKVTATNAGAGVLRVTAKLDDEPFTISAPSVDSFNQMFQMPANPNDGGRNGTTGDELSIGDIATTLANQINSSGLPISANVIGGALTITSTRDGSSFVVEVDQRAGTTPGHARLQFGGTDLAGNQVPAGTIRSIDIVGPGGTAVAPTQSAAGDDATIGFTVDFGNGPQQIELNMGKFQRAGGVVQYGGDKLNVSSVLQDGAPRGEYKEVEINQTGDVVVNFSNGRSRTVAKVPLTSFNNPNALERQTGGIYAQTSLSGNPNGPFIAGTNGIGLIVPSALESSNVDIADEFTKLIVTQRTYSANTKIVTTSDEMLQEALNLKR